MKKHYAEWLKQADYDIETAEHMLSAGRRVYAVYMCQLSIEKALKGLYVYKLDAIPPKTHNLTLLLTHIGLVPPETTGRLVITLNEAGIITRYPDDLEEVQRTYPENAVKQIIYDSRDALAWIKQQF